MIIFYLNMRVQILKTDLFLKDNQFEMIRKVRRENLCVPETKRAALLKALVRGCSVVSGSP